MNKQLDNQNSNSAVFETLNYITNFLVNIYKMTSLITTI